ncbi:MAG: FMN reductase [Lentisphaerae bacterium RIFOXYB12_FULL_65_16]|nr:MAG: FMN reductase [Lentisphaerae bacterium RIFOXYA12_64_32]OGV87460.1 MAG: FMN reductase [Lentisphaerae bacterium RIFOXYB12_FULL_65_16]
MKAVAFNGSPRKGGNTELLLRAVLEPIAAAGIETELVQVGGRPIRGCTACLKCMDAKNQRCAIKDDILNDCLAKMVEADAIILGSPTYFAGMTSELKALIDRSGFVAFANDRMFSRKIGAGVVAVRRGGATSVLDSINHMFLMSRMIVPGSTYWNFGVGLDKGEAANDQEGMANMRDLGETIAWLIKTTAAGRQSGA